jgi:3-oxoacyl-[acyl-carrier protein] reductase
MFERFTDRARKVMALANQEAHRLNHEYIGTEHILLGLIKEGSGVGATVLKKLDVDPGKVRLEVEKLVKSGPDMDTVGKLPQKPHAKKVIQYAIEEARNLNHNYVGTEHLLLGLLREEDGVAAQVLMNLSLKLEQVREEVVNLLGTSVESEELGVAGPAHEPKKGKSKAPALDWFERELTEIARHEIRELSGKRAIVCGSTQGIGRACAVEIARLGAEVTLVARDEQALRNTVGDLPADAGQTHHYVVADFTEPDAVRSKVEEHVGQTGSIHILLNNTGGPPSGPIVDAAPEAFKKAFAMHVLCNQMLAQVVIPGMKAAGYGRIINIISSSVRTPIKGLGVSNTIRAAVANWAKTMASELAPFGITVNNILPGYIDTARLRSLIKVLAERAGKNEKDIENSMLAAIPAGRFGKPEEIASVVGFLASPAASYVSGVDLQVDGARLATQ